jgi:hypothetical protein
VDGRRRARVLDDALDAEAFAVGEVLDCRVVAGRFGGGQGDGLGDRVLGGILDRPDA